MVRVRAEPKPVNGERIQLEHTRQTGKATHQKNAKKSEREILKVDPTPKKNFDFGLWLGCVVCMYYPKPPYI